MGNKPRNPRYFPHMRVRGKQRRRVSAFQWVAGAFDRLTVETDKTAKALRGLVAICNEPKETNSVD